MNAQDKQKHDRRMERYENMRRNVVELVKVLKKIDADLPPEYPKRYTDIVIVRADIERLRRAISDADAILSLPA